MDPNQALAFLDAMMGYAHKKGAFTDRPMGDSATAVEAIRVLNNTLNPPVQKPAEPDKGDCGCPDPALPAAKETA